MKRVAYCSGEVINGLVFVKESNPRKSPSRVHRAALFRCRCGNEFETIIRSVVSGNTRSCGCSTGVTARRDRTAKHHLRWHPLYSVWGSIKTRCLNSKRPDYRYYGGSGIKISDEFRHDFKAFHDYVSGLEGYDRREIDSLTLDRIDNSGDYTKGNLRWITRKEQASNRRNNVKS